MILAPTEISECLTGGPTAVARAIEAAVIAKLCAGVEMPRNVANMYDAEYSSGSYSPAFTETRVTMNPVLAGSNVKKLYTADQLRTVAAAARLKALEEAAVVLDASADRQEAEWKAHIASNKNTHATSLHAIPRGYAQDIRALKGTT